MQKCDNLLNQKRSYEANVTKHSNEEKIANWYRLLGSVCSSRFLLENSLSFRGHDESEDSFSKGLFLAVLKLICENNPDIGKYCLGNAKKNNKLTAPSIQKEIIDCFAKEVTKKLCEEFKDDVFGLLADESSDVSQKEQMAIVVRYVDKRGIVKESLIGVAHVNNTSSATLKEAILIKTDLRNRMGNEYLNNALVFVVERETFDKVNEEDVMVRFQAIKNRRGDIYSPT
ncbi:uncharacterized protein LOC143616512 [Bidens hawaiensis]|uniref:uncharacterized protein LOC143616512 n=1 Tax=Bidens hawaiensis TaxID=980011 RepID=UPI0040498567